MLYRETKRAGTRGRLSRTTSPRQMVSGSVLSPMREHQRRLTLPSFAMVGRESRSLARWRASTDNL